MKIRDSDSRVHGVGLSTKTQHNVAGAIFDTKVGSRISVVYALDKPVSFGLLAFVLLLAVYFVVLALVSGWAFTLTQFAEFWYYIVPLAAGFGLQVALFSRLHRLLHQSGADSRTVVAASGTTSTVAMVSCCAHYLVTVAPVLGATGLVTFAAQYQVEFFWIGIAFNVAGIAFIGNRLWKATKEHALCVHT